jgi:hypothetical protein
MTDVVLHTAGDGYWSTVAKAVRIVDIKITYVNEDRDFGELCVYFNTEDWDVETDGLIYTDSAFLEELKDYLITQELGDDFSYSEQGMQGDDYVSLDCYEGFIKNWVAKFGEASIADVLV